MSALARAAVLSYDDCEGRLRLSYRTTDQLRKGPSKVDFSPKRSVEATAVTAKESTPLTRKKFMNCCGKSYLTMIRACFHRGLDMRGLGRLGHFREALDSGNGLRGQINGLRTGKVKVIF